MNEVKSIIVVGLGYVGLPLLIALGKTKRHKVVGYDIDDLRVKSLAQGVDSNNETNGQLPDGILLTSNLEVLAHHTFDFIICTVPTPVDKNNRPDLSLLKSATQAIGARLLSRGTIVIYESTVYPGVTEDILVPILENESGMTLNADFAVGYSPERINPGDNCHTLESIVKIVSASNKGALKEVKALYGGIIKAGIFEASSLRIAEAAKAIENAQRDINIAFINELSIIFNRMEIDFSEVLEAAGTKWNFLPFRPGLVGGHCIGVDPYYLADCSRKHGYEPEVILAGRNLNDRMHLEIIERITRELINRKSAERCRLLVLGLSFKPNVSDTRNSRVFNLIEELCARKHEVEAWDPVASLSENASPGGFLLHQNSDTIVGPFDGIILAVAHEKIKEVATKIVEITLSSEGIVFDVMHVVQDLQRKDIRLMRL